MWVMWFQNHRYMEDRTKCMTQSVTDTGISLVTSHCMHIFKKYIKRTYFLRSTITWIYLEIRVQRDFPWWLSGKEPTYKAGVAGDTGSIPGLGRCHGGGHGNPLQYFCLENLMDRGAWWATVHRVSNSRTQLKWVSTHACEALEESLGVTLKLQYEF